MDLKLIDIHAHVNFNAFRLDGDDVVRRTLAEQIGMILVGSQIDTSRRAIKYAERYPEGVWAAVGLHPIHLVSFEVDASELGEVGPDGAVGVTGFQSRPEVFNHDLYHEIAIHKKTVAIGECGLDYYRTGQSHEEKTLQHNTLREQIRLARDVKKPLIIHCRSPRVEAGNAYDDLYRILQEEQAGDVGGTIHFFVGTWEDAQKFLGLGFHLSFTGVITFARNYDEVVQKIPLDRIMVETDAPYVAPILHRGRRNEPLYVRDIAIKVAELRGMQFEEVAAATTANARKLFRL
ncbi:MAG: TatD family hydrolase [Patescibacteria group bacterium]